jgi:hypothetical protein
MTERRTVDIANTTVMNKEINDLKRLKDDTQLEQTSEKLCELEEELRRLDPKKKYDHEEVWYATGNYTKGHKGGAEIYKPKK